MGVGFASFEIARSGLFVNERGLYVTGHNISNVNTAGYVRQQAIATTGPYQNENGKYQMGLGADIQQIRQLRHIFLDSIYRSESTTLGYWESKNKTIQDIQSILGEPMGSGLQNVMNQFWDSWQELSKAPDSLTTRALVRQRGEALVHHVNHIGSQIDKLQSDLNSEIRVRIDEVNDITDKISKLNIEILKVEVSQDTANDYRDQRNTLLDRLSRLINAEVTEMNDGQIDITAGGYFLVSKGDSTKLFAAESKAGGLFYVPKIEGTDMELPLRSGIIKGLLESRGEVLGSMGSLQNGTPNNKVDITVVVDTTSGSPVNAAYINNYASELIKKGMNVSINTINVAAADFNDISTALNSITGLRPQANKYALIFTDKDTGAAADIDNAVNILNAKGIKASAITGTSAAAWADVTEATGGKTYDILSADYNSLMNTLSGDTNKDINVNISSVPPSTNIIPDIKKKLNALINIMAREVNYLHKSGKTFGKPPSDGADFFTPVNAQYPLEMGNFKLNSNLLDLDNIVASGTGDNGDNSIALSIANLRHKPLLTDVKGLLGTDDYYQSIILAVGNDGAEAERISENQSKLVDSADSYRQSIMGVSMDEEMANMMKYKFAYAASSKSINVIDEMLETVINRMGVSGR